MLLGANLIELVKVRVSSCRFALQIIISCSLTSGCSNDSVPCMLKEGMHMLNLVRALQMSELIELVLVQDSTSVCAGGS